jgi:hypothetical protein
VRQVAAEALGLQNQLTQQPAHWRDRADRQWREGAGLEHGRLRGGACWLLAAGLGRVDGVVDQ